LILLIAGLATGGCSMSFPLSSLIPGMQAEKPADKDDITGSLSMQHPAASREMTNADWTVAMAALREALGRKEDGASIPWQNPTTSSRGTVSPVSAAFVQDGFNCRNFMVSHFKTERENWYEGTACRTHRGQWDIQSTRPLQKS
jgi:surface antigen